MAIVKTVAAHVLSPTSGLKVLLEVDAKIRCNQRGLHHLRHSWHWPKYFLCKVSVAKYNLLQTETVHSNKLNFPW